jgi:hypothetical protein
VSRGRWSALGLGCVVLAALSVLLIRNATGDDERVLSAGDLASRIGCESFEVDREAPRMIAQVVGAGTCVLAGEQVLILYYGSRAHRDEARDQMSGFAETGLLEPVRILFGENWSVSIPDAGAVDALQALQDDVGGELIR